MTPKMIEEKARELFNIHAKDYPIDFEEGFKIARDWWIPIAKHVLQSEIRARIEDINLVIMNAPMIVVQRVKDLEAQLTLLKGGLDGN